ncbi:hypothetical protein KC878_01690 [Candidatus Saccharibacteria bacterium]|nr:hypothetical protein [Candidatus Saccharibacteria bacterium]MCB9821685.1 hypothetical protein [Candidatus Nomurabacteria bacterium]
MLPSLTPGRVVVAIHKKWDIGDVVIARVRQIEVIKRVSSFSVSKVCLKGDNRNHSQDEDVYESQVIAKVVWPRGLTKV